MASLDHAPLVHAYQALFDVTRDDLEDIAKHLTKAKGQGIIDILGQIAELLQRIQTASSPTKLEIEVARAIARDFDTIAKRWNEMEQYFVNEIQYDDYVYRSDEDRAIAAEKAQRIIQEQALQALDAAGAMFGVAREWRRAATCFETVVQARKAKETPLLALPAIIRAYRCYEELSDASKVLSTGQEIQKLLMTVTGEISPQDQAMLQEAAEFFRKTAMAAVTNRKKDPDLNIPLASIFLWNEAETLNLITPADDDTALSRFRALAEFFEQVGKEELAKPTPSLQRFIASYMEGTFANLRITRNISGFTIKEAQQQALQLTQYATDFILTLIERLGYHRVRIVQDPSKAMKGLIATFELIQRGYKGSKAFQDLAKQAGVTLVQAQQRADQILIDLATVFRWLCEGSSGALYVISMKLITDIYRVAIISDVLDVGSKEELRKRILDLLGLAEEDELFGLLIDTEVEFDDVVDLFKSLDLYWVSAICKLNQGQLRQNLTFLEVEMASPVSSEQEIVGIPEDEQKLDAMPFWGAAPSIDFTTAADLYSRAFRLKRGADESFPTEGIDNWIPHRDPEDLKRRAAYSHWLAGLANLEEGNIEDGGRQLFLAKNSYELLGRHREAILCLEIWMRQLVVTIRPEEGGGARPTQARLEELLNVCDELVGLYALRQTTPETIDDILNIIRFLQNEVGLENWTLSVYLRTIEYSREAHSIALQLGTPEEALEMLRFLREELSAFLGSDFAIGVYPNFDTEATIYFEAETPVKLAILNISEQEAIDLTIRPVGILPHLSPNPSQPWQASRDPSQITMKHFYIGSDDDAFTIDDLNYPYKPADAFGPSRPIPVSLEPTPDSLIEVESTLERAGEQPWLGVMWSGDYNGTTIGTLAGVTEEPPSKDTPRPPIDDLKQAAFFTVFTKSAREGNILPGQIFPVTFGIYSRGSSEPIAIQTIYFKIASRPKILKAQTQWATDLEDEWEESFGIRFEEGAHLPMYAPRFAPEYESKDYVNPQTLTPTITIGSEAVDLTKYLKHVPYHFNLRYKGKRTLHSGNNYLIKSDISLEMPYAGQIEGNYEFLRIRTPPRIMTAEELAMPRLRNGVNFQELFYGTVFIGDADFDGEYYVYRLWICFEPGEKTPAPGASYRQGWTNHRLDIFLDPKNWEPRLLITDYYVEFEDGRGEWVEALFTFKAASSTWFGIRRLTADLYREAKLKDYPDPFESEIRHALQPVGVTEDTPLKITGFALGQRLGFIELIRAVWARNKNDGPVIFKPPRAHLFRDYWSQRYEHGLYREDWYGGPDVNLYEMKYNDRSGGQSKYIRGFKKRDFPHEVSIKAREGDRCDLFITPPVESAESMIIRNVINPRKIELWTRPHVSFSRRFNFIAKYFGRPPKIHTASLYFYSTRRELNPYYKGRVRGKDQWIHYPEAKFWDGKQWTPIPEHFDPAPHPENLSYGINSWLEADAYWVYRYVWYWPLEFTFPLPHDDWERADIWVNARTGKIEWITSDYHWRELWYQNAVKVSGVNPIIDFLFNWNTPEPLTVKDGAQVHQSIVPYFKEGKTVGEFADQLPWMFARYKQSCEHLHHLHQTWAGRNKVKIVYGGIFLLIFFLLSVWFFFFHPLGISWNPFWPPP
ncbi:MAG: hypothetical protein ACFFBX_04260 [Promethearchaeota archaeon]